MKRAERPVSVDDLLTLAEQLERDETLDHEQRARRDRSIGRALQHLAPHPAAQMCAWLDEIAARDGQPERSPHLGSAPGTIGFALLLLGLALGWGAALALFYYDGSRPINVVNVLAVLIALPAVLLALAAVLAMPQRWSRYVPGFAFAQAFLRSVNPGRLGALAARMLPQQSRAAVHSLLGRGTASRKLYAGVAKWLLLLWSQIIALGFSLGVMLGALSLIVFSDLAFGWSTTLDVEAEVFHALTQWLSMPWKAWLPSAVPTLELVEGSRFFRLGDGLISGTGDELSRGAARLGAWWPFLLSALGCYALAPRIVSAAIARWRFRANVDATMLRLPGARALVERLNTPLVETSATAADAATEPARDAQHIEVQALESVARVAVADWNGAAGSREVARQRLRHRIRGELAGYVAVGGANSVAEDRSAIANLVNQANQAELAESGGAADVVVMVKAWEPPMLDVLDFLQDLRSTLGEGLAVTVFAVPVSPEQGAAASEREIETWRRKLEAQGDPWLRLAT